MGVVRLLESLHANSNNYTVDAASTLTEKDVDRIVSEHLAKLGKANRAYKWKHSRKRTR